MKNFVSRSSVRRVIRTFVIAFVGLAGPGLLGWLNDLTSWARAEGSTPFPDAHGLAYLAVAATVAGVIASGNLLWNLVEDWLGVGFLRDPTVGDDEAVLVLGDENEIDGHA